MSASLAILQTSTSRGSLEEDLNQESEGKGSPFLKCVVSIWALSVRGDVRACQDGFGHFFHVCPFDKEGWF